MADTFLLTHPVWDVTPDYRLNENDYTISTHTSRVGCDVRVECSGFIRRISTHTSRVGCDDCYRALEMVQVISTHTSRVGCDLKPVEHTVQSKNFYSHIPCGM